MAAEVGKVGMTKLEYTGSKMSATWSGPVTNARYTFGADKRRGWVDKRDVGSREERTGFLAMKDKTTNSYLFKVVDNSQESMTKVAEPVKVVSVMEESSQVSDSSVEPVTDVNAANAEVTGSLTIKPTSAVSFPDPNDLNVEEIKRLDLTREQWVEVYKAEMAGRNRKGAIAFLEELLANLS